VPCDLVLVVTPVDLGRSLGLRHPALRVRYEAEAAGPLGFEEVLAGL
jgi:hypothetical protein